MAMVNKNLLPENGRLQTKSGIVLDGWVIEPDAMPPHCIDVLMGGIQRRDPVTQAADQGIQRLVGNTSNLLIAPNRSNKIGTADDLAATFIQQPEQLELLCRKRWHELLLIHPNSPRF